MENVASTETKLHTDDIRNEREREKKKRSILVCDGERDAEDALLMGSCPSTGADDGE